MNNYKPNFSIDNFIACKRQTRKTYEKNSDTVLAITIFQIDWEHSTRGVMGTGYKMQSISADNQDCRSYEWIETLFEKISPTPVPKNSGIDEIMLEILLLNAINCLIDISGKIIKE